MLENLEAIELEIEKGSLDQGTHLQQHMNIA